VTCLRAGMTPDGSAWQVEQSEDGIHAHVVASGLKSAADARALIDSLEGRLSPLRGAPDSLPAHPEATN
jgi:hypothetical protein